MKLRAILGLALFVVLLAVPACGGGGGGAAGGTGPKSVTVTATDFKFDPSSISVSKGQQVTVNFQNKGATTHNFDIPDLNVKTKDASAGQSDTVTFTPDKTGTFQYICSIPGHKEAGMVGNLVVQ